MTKKDLTGKGFEFVETGHAYYLDGKKMTGVTTILGVIAKPMLIPWASKMATEYIRENLSLNIFNDPVRFEALLNEAKNAHRAKKEEAGEKGTDVHAEVEILIKEALLTPTGLVGVYRGGNEQVKHFVKWATDNKVKFRASEEKIYSKEMFIAGTVDFYCEIDGELWIGDIKTSSAIYPEHFFQTAGYQKIMEDMGLEQNVKGHIILNLRKDGTFEEKRSISNEDNLLAFMSALNLYRVQQKISGTVL